MKALLIEFDGATGKRAGNLVIDDKLKCYGWQQLDAKKVVELGYVPKFASPGSICLEVRVIEDDRDVSQYEGIPGITVLHDDNEIQAAIDQYCTPAYRISNEALFRVHMEQKGVKLDNIPGKDTNEILKDLHAQGIKGISEIRRPTLVNVYGPPGTRAAKGLPE